MAKVVKMGNPTKFPLNSETVNFIEDSYENYG
jgi:hypothetical protein